MFSWFLGLAILDLFARRNGTYFSRIVACKKPRNNNKYVVQLSTYNFRSIGLKVVLSLCQLHKR